MKRLVLFCLVLAIVVGASSVAVFARDTDYTEGRSFTWSPYYFPVSVWGSSAYIEMRYTLKWDQAGVDWVNALLDPPNFWDYYTMENNDFTGAYLDGTTSGYTNLPTGTWAVEDDQGDGLDEEVEYYWANEGLVANYSYSYWVRWLKYSIPGYSDIHLISQMGPLHQGYDYDLLRKRYVEWTDTAYCSPPAVPDAQLTCDVADRGDRAWVSSSLGPCLVHERGGSVRVIAWPFHPADNLSKMMSAQRQFLGRISKNDSLVPVTVTFAPGTGREDALEIVSSTMAPGGYFMFQGLQADGVVGSGYFANTSQGLDAFAEACTSNGVESSWITGYEGTVLTAGDAERLFDCSSIRFVDFSKDVLRSELGRRYPGKRVSVVVPDKFVALCGTGH